MYCISWLPAIAFCMAEELVVLTAPCPLSAFKP